MPKKFATTAVAVTAAMGLMASPVMAQDEGSDTGVAEETSWENLKAAAAHARNAARQLEKADSEGDAGEEADEEAEDAAEEAEDAAEEAEGQDDSEDDAEDLKNAEQALQKALDRLSEEGAGGNGVAAKVLTALLAGESPAGIGAEHGKEMAAAAKEAREQRAADRAEAGKGKPDNTGKPDNAGKPARTDKGGKGNRP